MNKDKAIFWLNRRIKELEAKSAPPSQEAMATHGLSYGDRQAMVASKEKVAGDVEGELSSLKEVVAFLHEKA